MTVRETFFNHGQGLFGLREIDETARRVRYTEGTWLTLDAAEGAMWDDAACGPWTDWVPLPQEQKR